MRPRHFPLLVAFVLVSLSCGGATSESAASNGRKDSVREGSGEIERILEAWRANAEGVEAYTTVEMRDGNEQTRRYVKRVVDGLPTFVPSEADTTRTAPNLMAFLRYAERSGTGEVEGETTRTFVVDDAAALREGVGAETRIPIEPRRLEIQIGSDDMPRRMTLQGSVPSEDGPLPVETVVTMTDWRIVDGFAQPFRWSTRVEGAEALETAAVERATRSLEAQAGELTDEQEAAVREMVRRRIGGSIEKGANVTTVVKSLSVERE